MTAPPDRPDPVVERFLKPNPPRHREHRHENDPSSEAPEVEDRREEPTEEEPPDDELAATRVLVSRAAAGEVLRRGGQLFLWQRSVSAELATDVLTYGTPSGIHFTTIHVGGIHVHIESAIRLPEELRIERRHMTGGVAVYWDGRRWGARG